MMDPKRERERPFKKKAASYGPTDLIKSFEAYLMESMATPYKSNGTRVVTGI